MFDADSFSANHNTIIKANYPGLSNMIIMGGTTLMCVTSDKWFKIALLLLNKMIFLMIKYKNENLSSIKLMAKPPVTTTGWALFTFIEFTNFPAT